jgi:hypothetical protein
MKGFAYLVAIMDWHSRYVLSWELSNSMEDMLYVNGKSSPMIISPEDSRGGKLLPYPTPLVLSRDCYWLVSVPAGGFDSGYSPEAVSEVAGLPQEKILELMN